MKKRDLAVIIAACVMISAIFVLNIALPDQKVSESERRKLASFPSLSASSVFNGDFFSSLEEYALDQFPFRESFRKLKAFTVLHVLNQKDYNGLYESGYGLYKLTRTTNKSSVEAAIKQYQKIQNKFLENCNVYFSVVPDKSFYTAAKEGYPHMDYSYIFSAMKDSLTTMQYIDISTLLSEWDYYDTDLHWRQENITEIAQKLLADMKAKPFNDDFKKIKLTGFKGSYYGQWALTSYTDTLTYLTSDTLNNTKVYDYEKKEYIPVYSPEKFTGTDPYDVFLSGARALLRIENPNSDTDKELYIFRDSFSSSLAPLLCESYKAVTLIDLRYISLSELSNQISIPDGSDALFMYNTLILNDSSTIIKS